MYGGPKIKHLDEIPEEEMYRFRFKDGRTASIWEKWIELSPRYIAFWNRWDPGAMTPRHGHHGDHINLILEGEIRSQQGHVCRAGSHILLEYGDVFGPWVAGPEGCKLYGFMGGGEGRSFKGDLSTWEPWLMLHEAEVVPIPKPKRTAWWWTERTGAQNTMKWISEADSQAATASP